jgi:cyanophycin synthetase
MGQSGDLLLVFADALVRSWKQVIKFKPEGAAPKPMANETAPTMATPEPVGEETVSLSAWEGMVRDERGVRLAREDAD